MVAGCNQQVFSIRLALWLTVGMQLDAASPRSFSRDDAPLVRRPFWAHIGYVFQMLGHNSLLSESDRSEWFLTFGQDCASRADVAGIMVVGTRDINAGCGRFLLLLRESIKPHLALLRCCSDVG